MIEMNHDNLHWPELGGPEGRAGVEGGECEKTAGRAQESRRAKIPKVAADEWRDQAAAAARDSSGSPRQRPTSRTPKSNRHSTPRVASTSSPPARGSPLPCDTLPSRRATFLLLSAIRARLSQHALSPSPSLPSSRLSWAEAGHRRTAGRRH